MNPTTLKSKMLMAVAALLLLVIATAPPAFAGTPCCGITAINPSTGIVTAKVNATGKTFQFKASPQTLSSLKVGQGVYVNFKTNQVSLDGKSVFASITMLGSRVGGATGSSATGGSSVCCQVIGIVQGQNLAHAKVMTTGQTFDFALNDPTQMPQLHSGQPIYANFTTNQISLDGQDSAGHIVELNTGYNLSSDASAATAAPVHPPNTVGRSPVSAAPLDGFHSGTSAAPLDGVRSGTNVQSTNAAPLDGVRGTSAAPLDGVRGTTAAPLDGVRGTSAAPLDGAHVAANFKPANPGPCCEITAVNASTGIVTAKVNATGKTFQFKASPQLANTLKVGQGVFANFGSQQVSVDGLGPCCGITSALH